MIKKCRLKYVFLLLLGFCLSSSMMFGQGLNAYFGTSSAVNGLASVTPDGTAQTGFVIGGDARLNEGKMYFVVGLQYHQLALESSTDYKLFPDGEKFNVLKFRVGLGYDLFNIGEFVKIRGKTLASLDILGGIPDNHPIIYNDGVAGFVFGLGVDVAMITFDVELEKGMFNAVNKVSGSKYDFVNFTLGFIF